MSTSMIKVYPSLVLLVTILAVGSCYCPEDRMHSIGYCAYRISCSGTIRGISLPDRCRNASTTVVDLTLTDAIERFDSLLDKEFLISVTSFRATAVWKTTALSFLTHMPRLRHLVLSNDYIQCIEGSPFFSLNHLQHLDLSYNALTDIEDLFLFESQPNSVRTLSLAHNFIEDLPGDAFTELTNLKQLDLSYNMITDLSEEPFLNLTSLEILRLNNNKIKDLNGAVNNLVKLKHLYLRGNQIENIDSESLQIIYDLETFDISGNQLDNLKPIMFQRHWQHIGGVCKIILSENHITSIPNATSNEVVTRFTRALHHGVEMLTELDLSKNEITSIEYNAFRSVVRLINLDLSVNKLTDFIVNAQDLRDVKYLNLSCNHLTNLYFESFSSMSNLQNLDLSHNRLDYIPDETFTKNYNLRFVNMTFNELWNIKQLHMKMFHPDGGVLDLSNNGLSRLDVPMGEGLRLTTLVLNSNNVEEVGCINLYYQNDLKILEMKKNFIKRLNATSLRLPLSLVSLDLSNNAIKEIGPSTFHRVTHLNSLFLGHNKISELQYGVFQGLTALSNLDLSFNNMKNLDATVLMDLKSLKVLSLRSNGLYYLKYKAWLGHKHDLRVYLEGNSISCDWLGAALKDYNNGYSKMRPAVLQHRVGRFRHSLEGIPCIPSGVEMEKQVSLSSNSILADERLLVTNQKILEAVREQTYFLRTFMNQFNMNNHIDKLLRRRNIS